MAKLLKVKCDPMFHFIRNKLHDYVINFKLLTELRPDHIQFSTLSFPLLPPKKLNDKKKYCNCTHLLSWVEKRR